jgi:hypothetical protein
MIVRDTFISTWSLLLIVSNVGHVTHFFNTYKHMGHPPSHTCSTYRLYVLFTLIEMRSWFTHFDKIKYLSPTSQALPHNYILHIHTLRTSFPRQFIFNYVSNTMMIYI